MGGNTSKISSFEPGLKELKTLNIRAGQVWSIHGDEVLVIEAEATHFVLQGTVGGPQRISYNLMAAALTNMGSGSPDVRLVCDVKK